MIFVPREINYISFNHAPEEILLLFLSAKLCKQAPIILLGLFWGDVYTPSYEVGELKSYRTCDSAVIFYVQIYEVGEIQSCTCGHFDTLDMNYASSSHGMKWVDWTG